ncbi:MAG: pilus assembly protein [Massilia sp.]|uniref:pilus assembly protein n=1 Tax=Massilia sp. TaxID=1882437 RepID=UPI002FCA5D7D
MIIEALIAVAAIGVNSVFGQTMRIQTAGLANEMAGVDSATQIQAAGTTAATDDAGDEKAFMPIRSDAAGGAGNGVHAGLWRRCRAHCAPSFQ